MNLHPITPFLFGYHSAQESGFAWKSGDSPPSVLMKEILGRPKELTIVNGSDFCEIQSNG